MPVELGIPKGLKLAYDVISPEEEAFLLDACSRAGLRYYDQDPDNPRSRYSYGWEYDINSDKFAPSKPIPDEFSKICATAAEFGGTTPDQIIDCMVIRYEPGANIQPHYDKPVFDCIIGLSLGSDADMVFSKPEELGGDSVLVRLPRRSMYMMSEDARFVYRHGIPLVSSTRWSMTFRTLTAEGEALRQLFAKQAV